MNAVNGRQLTIMIFFIPLVFKMATLPSLLYQEAGVDGYICVAIFATMEFLQLWAVLSVCEKGGMQGIKKYYGDGIYRAVTLPLLFVIFVKSILFVSEITRYISTFLFYNIITVPILLTVIIVCCYIGLKGSRSIARIFEMTVWLVPVLLLMGVLFGKANLEGDYLMPVCTQGCMPILKATSRYLIYTFDFSPLLFCEIKIKNKKAIALSAVLCVFLVTACYMVLYARYGRASGLAGEGFARLASFDTVISEIGSLDWLSSLLWIEVAILNLALKAFAVGKIGNGLRIKNYIFSPLFGVAVALCLLFVWDNFQKALDFVTGGIQFAVVGVEVLLPFVLLLLYDRGKNKMSLSGVHV